MSEEKSAAGMIGAIAALITAVVGLGAFIFQVWPSDSPPAQPQAGPGAADTPAATSQPATATSTDAANPPGAPLWDGPLSFGSGVDFDTTPPTIGGTDGTDVHDSGDRHISILNDGSKFLAQWTKPGDPTPTDCASLIQTMGVSRLSFAQGNKFCVKTLGEGRIVFITFVKPGKDGKTYEIKATVWPAPN